MNNQRLEEASLNSWPGLQQTLFDGWVLRFSNGYTKRANSVNPVYPATLEAESKIAACERFYAAKNQPTIFRLTPFATPENLDALLEARGYDQIDLTRVRYLDLRPWEMQSTGEMTITDEPLDNWLSVFCQLTGSNLEKHGTHRQILEAIPYQTYFSVLWMDNQPVSCGVAVREDSIVGLFDLFTDEAHRRNGYALELVAAMLDRAKTNGAEHAYLQVVAANKPALALYNKIGFTEAYSYWYRIQRG